MIDEQEFRLHVVLIDTESRARRYITKQKKKKQQDRHKIKDIRSHLCNRPTTTTYVVVVVASVGVVFAGVIVSVWRSVVCNSVNFQ